jgi:hypothetical protein
MRALQNKRYPRCTARSPRLPCMKIAIRIMIGIGTPKNHSSIERIIGP